MRFFNSGTEFVPNLVSHCIIRSSLLPRASSDLLCRTSEMGEVRQWDSKGGNMEQWKGIWFYAMQWYFGVMELGLWLHDNLYSLQLCCLWDHLEKHKCKHIIHLCKFCVLDHRQGFNSIAEFLQQKAQQSTKSEMTRICSSID